MAKSSTQKLKPKRVHPIQGSEQGFPLISHRRLLQEAFTYIDTLTFGAVGSAVEAAILDLGDYMYDSLLGCRRISVPFVPIGAGE